MLAAHGEGFLARFTWRPYSLQERGPVRLTAGELVSRKPNKQAILKGGSRETPITDIGFKTLPDGLDIVCLYRNRSSAQIAFLDSEASR